MANYKDAGVDVHAGYKAVELMKAHVKKTMRPEVVSDIGGFGGLFSLGSFAGMQEPVLVSGTDGVGTKLKIAIEMDRHDTVGIDCVAMCVNDVVCSGAQPLFFLDYLAQGKLIPEKVEQIVKGIADGCVESGCALIGGETAEMPGFYPDGEYDMAGFVVGIVDRPKIIDGKNVRAGDTLIGIASSGIHSNGYSLVRKIFEITAEGLARHDEAIGSTVGEALLTPTKLYVKPILGLLKTHEVGGISNITGGGFIENIPRMIPKHLKAVIRRGTWPVPALFTRMQELGEVPERDMYNTFNMGIGMVLAARPETAESVIARLTELGEKAWVIGSIADADAKIEDTAMSGEQIEIC